MSAVLIASKFPERAAWRSFFRTLSVFRASDRILLPAEAIASVVPLKSLAIVWAMGAFAETSPSPPLPSPADWILRPETPWVDCVAVGTCDVEVSVAGLRLSPVADDV